ncbi:MAG: hypothetical protein R2939_17755 [Kofleriaceae bacterium]
MPRARGPLVGIAAAAVLAAASSAQADTFGGFAGSRYVVSPDRVCTPLAVSNGEARGQPSCDAVGTEGLARLSIKPASPETGARARFVARQDGKRVVVRRGDAAVDVVAWAPIDPLLRVGAVYASARGDQVAVEVVVRRMGREHTDLIGFELERAPADATPTAPTTPAAPTTTAPPTPDKAMLKLLKAARKTSGKKALVAWAKVLAIDPDASEAHAAIAAAHAKLGHLEDTLAALETLARSTRSDAIEYLVAARFDKAFRKLAAEPRFRAAVGLDRGATQLYARVMGQGGRWEQSGTACAAPTVALTLERNRSFALTVKTACSGEKWTSKFKGTWRLAGADGLELVLPNRGADDEVMPCQVVAAGGEDGLRCQVDADLEFTALAVRR